jgi:hypothetical protein
VSIVRGSNWATGIGCQRLIGVWADAIVIIKQGFLSIVYSVSEFKKTNNFQSFCQKNVGVIVPSRLHEIYT